MEITERINDNFNYMVVSRKGEMLRTYKYDTAKRFFDSNGGRFYLYAYHGLKTIRLLVDWEK